MAVRVRAPDRKAGAARRVDDATGPASGAALPQEGLCPTPTNPKPPHSVLHALACATCWHEPCCLSAQTRTLEHPTVLHTRKQDKKHVRTVLQRLVLVASNDAKPIMKARQRSAFPPNFVHSVDSSHMMMTAKRCADEGIAFAGVHDSFWTHAGTVTRMNQVRNWSGRNSKLCSHYQLCVTAPRPIIQEQPGPGD